MFKRRLKNITETLPSNASVDKADSSIVNPFKTNSSPDLNVKAIPDDSGLGWNDWESDDESRGLTTSEAEAGALDDSSPETRLESRLDDDERSTSQRGFDALLTGTRYELGAFYAKGGLGEVHEAIDLELGRRVVAKRIRPIYADNPVFRKRFLREAQITASLEHRGIVPVHGLCRQADGQPFYVMRRVKGMRLDTVIHEFYKKRPKSLKHDRDFRELLRRFADVCKTVQYAHSKNVIHRDLKPSNIMVRQFGETLVLDWGLAKRLDQDDSSDTEDLLFSQWLSERADSLKDNAKPTRVGTIHYMSPEQLLSPSAAVGRHSDIFSLGATLYHLLAGEPPTRVVNDANGLVLLDLDDIPLPSRINPNVPRALEAVCLQAMKADPADRYESAEGIALDIESWLSDEPVNGYDEPITDTLARGIRRHQSYCVGAAAILFTFFLMLSFTAARIRREREAALFADHEKSIAIGKLERSLRDSAQALHIALKSIANPLYFEFTTDAAVRRKRVAEENLQTLGELKSLDPNNVSVKSSIAFNWHELGFISGLEGDIDKAETYFETSIDLFKSIVNFDPFAFLQRETVVTELCHLKVQAGRPQEAIPLLQASLNRIDTERPPYIPLGGNLLFVQAVLYSKLGVSYKMTGKIPESLKALAEADSRWKTILERHDEPFERNLSNSIQYRAIHAGVLMDAGRSDEALEMADSNVDRARKFLKDSSRNPSRLSVLAMAQIGRCAILLQMKRRLSEARSDMDQVIKIDQALADDSKMFQLSVGSLGEALLMKSSIESELKLWPEALADAESSRAAFERLTTTSPALIYYRDMLAEALGEVASLKSRAGETAEAESILRRAIQIESECLRLNPENPWTKTHLQEHQTLLESLELAELHPTAKPREPNP